MGGFVFKDRAVKDAEEILARLDSLPGMVEVRCTDIGEQRRISDALRTMCDKRKRSYIDIHPRIAWMWYGNPAS